MSKRAIIYTRFSSDLQQATSLEDQERMAREYCMHNGWTVVAVYSDMEMTGRNIRRPGFQAMKDAAMAGQADVVVIEAVDRLTRRLADALNHFEILQFQGVTLHSVTEGPQDFFKVLFAGFGAQNFSEMIAAHTRRGMRGALSRGRLHTRAYGYRKRDVPEGLNREIDPERAKIVTRIFTEFAEGRSSKQIAAGLNADGVEAPNGGTWEASSLRGNGARHEGILRNRLYIGIASVCKNGRHYHPETGSKKSFETQADAVEHAFPELRIISDDLWDAARAELERRQRATGAKGNPRSAHRTRYLLSGLLRCGHCGAPYVMASKTSYSCREARKGACANRTAISRRRIEARVFGALRAAFQAPGMLDRFESALKQERAKLAGANLEVEEARLRKAVASFERKRKNLFRAIEDGAPYADLKSPLEDAGHGLAAAEAELADLQRRKQQQGQPEMAPRIVYARIVAQMEALLGDPSMVDQAHTYLKMLIAPIDLIPDDTAPHGIRAEFETDLASLVHSEDPGAEGKAPKQRIVC